ncbi:peroxisome proliferator-activated receptor gamma coactivator-related protein 1-like [Myxocyprinus asiaticus]|uniref:peroxisome proliferator-activated receptor gamma coactivator-related protein 1-like n=1 Tax=Myxocyprinus asiaticus TaxID=70543 RepID=UPI002223AA85|nr:peroxisome proliferator-activated receptor gamma coactivator-related protein 1-like [Myxocyprinus asiaticus]
MQLIHVYLLSCKMAARWGTGEEMLKACNSQMFPSVNLDEAEMLQGSFSGSFLEYHSLNNGDTLEALHGCLDPSILSIFEDSPTGEYSQVKSNIDEESEATLLTALTEILDNVDDENLSPFDTLPDSDLFSGQRGQEHSPLRKFLSWSPTEKESIIHTRQFPGKSLPRMQRASQQNSEGEDEDGDACLTPITNIDLSSLDEFDWCLPVSLEQHGESMPVTLSDLVKHMHHYCMTVCVEEDGQEHLLPEQGIVLEVVDQGEYGEPILAIPDLSFSFPVSHSDLIESEQSVPEKNMAELEANLKDSSENVLPPPEVSPVEQEKVVVKVYRNESNSRGGKNQKIIESPSVERRVLRSSSSRVKEESQKKQEKRKKKKVTFSPVLLSAETEKPELKNSTGLVIKLEPQVDKEHIMTPQADATINKSKPEDKPLPSALNLEKSVKVELPSKEEPVSVQPAVCQRSETKPKPLNLQQYRLLRQQKKPDPVNKLEDNSTKWPKLPEAPKDLPPIPCLPDPNPRYTRKTLSTPVKDLAPEIMPAWHPRGPAAPPTPEALLVPPASMMASSKKPASSKSAPLPACTSAESSPQAFQPSTSTSSQKRPTETSPSFVSPQKLPAPTSIQENTIKSETSHPEREEAAKQKPPERTISLPVPSTSSPKECLRRNPSAAHVIEDVPVALSKVQDPSRPESPTTTQVQSFNSTPHKLNAAMPLKTKTEQVVLAPVPDQAKSTLPSNSKKLASRSQPHVAPIAAQPFFSAQVQARVVELAEQMRMASSEIPKPKKTTELIESFTSEIGIEAADLTSLLEQFEESQSKEEQSVPEVCGRAAAVGNSSFEQQVETKALEKTRNHDLGSTAGITPPATPPHPMWKPIAPVALLGKPKKSEVFKSTPNKAIHIEAKPLPSNKLRSKPQTPTTVGQTQPFSLDHDYCLPPKEPHLNEVGNRWNVKQQPSIIIKTIELPSNKAVQHSVSKAQSTPSVTEGTQRNLNLSQPSVDRKCTETDALNSSVLVTPDASPNRPESESPLLAEAKCNQQKPLAYSKCSSRQYQQERGRARRRYRAQSSTSSESSSESSSISRSPPRKRYRSRHSSSRSSSPSRSCSRSSSRSFSPPCRRRYSYSSSRSGSWSRSRSRSRSCSFDSHRRQYWTRKISPNERSGYCYSQNSNEDMKRRKQKAIEERRIVYVGRIRGTMTCKELKERFSFFGEIEECTVHFRENGDNYGFVTYYSTKDAFDAIESGGKLRQPNELPFDLCFGGRRQFCKTNYADLDSNREYDPMPTKGRLDALDFDTLLKQAQRNLKR